MHIVAEISLAPVFPCISSSEYFYVTPSKINNVFKIEAISVDF